VNAGAIPWTAGLGLRCTACDWTGPPELRFDGCERCHAPLETTYANGAHTPIPAAARTALGLRATPLVRSRSAPATFLKLEGANPTGSHKDRFHALTSAIARLGGAQGVVTASTGNHGVSCAAHAARDGLPCIVFATGPLPRALGVQIGAYGAGIEHVDADERSARISALTADGWLPATASDPALTGVGNPYGLDGYAAIADEIVHDLGAAPAIVCVPVASGDLLEGIARGFRRHARAGRRTLVVACQPIAASPLAASLAEGRPVILEQHTSLARSTSDAATGRLALAAVRDDCALVTVSEERIADATRRLALEGVYAETSSALALAGVEEARARELAGADDVAVAIVTATGRGWSEEVEGLFSPLRSERAAQLTGSRSPQA
jgi:threonine synthase